MSEKRTLPIARYVQCGFHKLADDPCKGRFGTHFASCPIKRTMISSSAPSTARVWPSRVPSPHPTRPSSSVIFTKSQRGFTLKYSMSLIGAMSNGMVLIKKVALVTRSDVNPLATCSYMDAINSTQMPRLTDSVHIATTSRGVLQKPRRSAWGYQSLFGDPISRADSLEICTGSVEKLGWQP
jgi:hypothetical protein